MASHVVVIDSTARRAMVKTTPNKYLSDVLEEACAKFGLNASQYGLKNNNKQIDLSRTIRLSGLSSGAKLELVQLSKSAGVVSVALQLPDSEVQGVPNARLTDKFPSTTTLWLILRKFEAGVAGGGTKRNLTARGAPGTNTGNTGAGRLYYQTPVLQIMGRELSSFTDLQRSLAQLGFNSGTTLLRLSFRTSETPLEEAMEQIEGYFKSVDGPVVDNTTTSKPVLATELSEKKAEDVSTAETAKPTPEWTTEEGSISTQVPTSDSTELMTPSSPLPIDTAITSTGRPLSVFAPSTSSTPAAALPSTFNPSDYTPTIEHAQSHQRLLSQTSRNVRLLTDAETAAQQASEQEKLAAIRAVEIKVRFPDESAVSASFGQGDSGATLYKFVRECLDDRWQGEGFVLRNPGLRGGKRGEEIVPDVENKKLIRDLGLKGRVMVVFGWDEAVGPEVRAAGNAVLKPELRRQAQEIRVKEIAAASTTDGADDQGTRVDLSGSKGDDSAGKKKSGGVPKWLKGLSKK